MQALIILATEIMHLYRHDYASMSDATGSNIGERPGACKRVWIRDTQDHTYTTPGSCGGGLFYRFL
jgi:hypothetical protein